MASTTPVEAPAEMPRMRGSAMGLRVSVCMITPATARAMPTSRPTRVRGTRKLRTISEFSTVDGSSTSPSGIILLPIARLAATAARSRSAPSTTTPPRFTAPCTTSLPGRPFPTETELR